MLLTIGVMRFSGSSWRWREKQQQWRRQLSLLGGVAALVIIVVGLLSTQPPPSTRRVSELAQQADQLDFAVRSEHARPLADDEFRALPEPQPSGTMTDDFTDPQPSTAGKSPGLVDAPTMAPAVEAMPQSTHPLEIPQEWLQTIEDNTLGIRAKEATAFYGILRMLARLPQQVLEHAADREALYINLMTDPERYRGRPVTIQGDMWRCYPVPIRDTTAGLSQLYEGWIFTADSGTHPYRVVCTALGMGLKTGEHLRVPVKVTGIFFKREGYRTPGGLHVAPTLLAKRIQIQRAGFSSHQPDRLDPLTLAVVVALGLILTTTFVAVIWQDVRRRMTSRVERSAETMLAENHALDYWRRLTERAEDSADISSP
ncbi:MAG: hypothetical protein KatS3mg114_0766 [Planctomycetaceae bacterium]|nr:MAG: hypothetical protein KatS3mg114_0766 [Planctomycetaceae bacterium]